MDMSDPATVGQYLQPFLMLKCEEGTAEAKV